MRYPHRVRFTDPRNRQPPEGVAYAAWKYDYINLPSRPEFRELDLQDGTFVEPSGSEVASIEVDALVTMVNDGDNNQDFVAYSVKVPSAEVSRAGDHFREQRVRSQEEFGYAEIISTSPNEFYRGINLSGAGQNLLAWRGNKRTAIALSLDPNSSLGPLMAIDNATGSSDLPARNLDVALLSISGTFNDPSPLNRRARSGVAEYKETVSNSYSLLTGFWPPIASWSTTKRNDFYRKMEQEIAGNDNSYRTYWVGFGAQADEGYWGYPYTLTTYRVDTFPDMVDFRARVDFTWL